MEKKVYGKRNTVTSYAVVYGCSRADRSFSTLSMARAYIKQSPACKGCLYCDEHKFAVGLYKRVVMNVPLKPFVK